MAKLGERIRTRRTQLGWTQEELAKKMGYKSRSSINKIEIGENDIPQSKIIKFAKALDATPSYLMGWTENPKESVQHRTDSEVSFFNKLLIEGRNQKGYTRAQLAELIGRGVSEEDVTYVEQGFMYLDETVMEMHKFLVGINLAQWAIDTFTRCYKNKEPFVLCPIDPKQDKYLDNEKLFIADCVTYLHRQEEEDDAYAEFHDNIFDLVENMDPEERRSVYQQITIYTKFLIEQRNIKKKDRNILPIK